ncbi:hypothetical protein SKAU_G00033290 [Synaphobranchus kaupii]|uniref:Interferon-induced very large GTPase 1 domain-containing protein n=1 Tax=Synaphobranchus kaupii TaxID=118154 RepID=A0A9Q1GFF9_SYNKA|nr:hypothetical protein SKAU_G00033290 [Synaphobranchus kaupii]
MVYNSLEEKYAAWSWELRKHAMEMHSELHNQIGSDLIQDVNAVNLTETFDKVYYPLQHEIEKYFKEDKDKDTLITWKANIHKRFRNLRSELIDGVAKKCRELISSNKHRFELDQRKTEYTAKLTKKSKALATDLKSQRLDDKKVTEEFDNLWGNWTADVAKAHIPKEAANVKHVVEATLQKQFENTPNILQKIKGVKENFEFNNEKHVSQSFWTYLTTSLKNVPNEIQQKVISSVNIYVTEKEHNKEDFHESFIYEILKVIEKTIREIECSTTKFQVTNEFQVDFSTHLCLNYVPRFQRMHETFNTRNNPLTYVKNQRDIYLKAFRNYYKGAKSVNIFVDFLCEHIKPGVLTAVNDKTSRQIADEMKNNNPAFNSNRSNLENHILKHLANKEDFSSFEEYIDNPKGYFKRFIKEKIENVCSDTGKQNIFHQKNLEILKSQILEASTAVTKEVEGKKGNASMWLDCFCKTAGKHMVINRYELRAIENEDIEDRQFLEDMMAKSLKEMMKDKKEADVETLKQKTTEYLFQQLQGCWAQCPFCTAICTNTIPNHDTEHSVQFHRCSALVGSYYENTNMFLVHFCTTAISSDKRFITYNPRKEIPYKTYRDAGEPFNRWSITPDGSEQHYWKWFICRFQVDWEEKKGYKFVGHGEIPDEWKTFTKESALEQLK